MKQVTAVEWFNQQLVDRQNGDGDSRSWDEILDQAKEMEKQQIVDASNSDKYLTHDFVFRAMNNKNSLGEQYYSETFNK